MTTPIVWKSAVSSRFPDLVSDLEVSETGSVRKKTTQRVFKYDQKDCYQCIKRKGKTIYLHTLVAESFLGVRPEGMVIDHIDGAKGNNAVVNLRYTTVLDNCKKGNRPLVAMEDGSAQITAKATARHYRENMVRTLNALQTHMSRADELIEVLAFQNEKQQSMIEDSYRAIHSLYMLLESTTQTLPSPTMPVRQ